MGWWVYENWTAEQGGKAIIHDGNCSFCREGKGIHKEDSGRNGKWHGPFENREDAYFQAKKMNRSRTTFCSFCVASKGSDSSHPSKGFE